MTDALDTKIRAFLVELVDAAPSPPEFDAIEHTQLATSPGSTRSQMNARSALVAVGIILGVVAAIGITVVVSDDGQTDRVPAADSTTQTTSPALHADACTVNSTGVPGCTATPEQATPLFGAVPHSPSRLPDGWKLVRQDLRIYQTGEAAVNGTGYFQLWTPSGAQPGAAGNYDVVLQLRQHVQQATQTDPPECDGATTNRVRQMLANGSQACVTTLGEATDQAPDQFTAEWFHDGIGFILEGRGLPRAEFDQTLNSIP